MRLTFTPDKRSVVFVPETLAEDTILTKFPAFLKKGGQRIAPALPHILQNILSRVKPRLKLPVTTKEKEIVDLLKAKPTLLDLPKCFEFKTAPLPHQHLALRYLYTHGGGGLLLDPGLGKTKIILDYIALMGFKKSIIVCPAALKYVWVDEVETHRPDLKIHVMESTSWNALIRSAEMRKAKWGKAVEEDPTKSALANYRRACHDLEVLPGLRDEDIRQAQEADIIVVNYHKVVIDTEQSRQGILGGADFLMKHFSFDFIGLDEALIKSATSARTRDLLKMGAKIPYRSIMSGTLINNNALDAFSPIRFLHPSLVGMAFGRFDFHYAQKVKMGRNGPMVTVGISKKSTEEIRGILEACCIVMRKEDWLTLPPKRFYPVLVELSKVQKMMYSELVSNHSLVMPNGDVVEAANGLAMMAKASQIANGFLYYRESTGDFLDVLFGKEVELGDRQTKLFDTQPKLEALKGLMEGSIKDRKFILWYNCSAELQLISQFLEDQRVDFEVIRGGTKNIGERVRMFNRNPAIKVLVCQAKAVNYGITVLGRDPEALDSEQEVLPDFTTKVFTHVFYSLNYSLEVFLQQQDRSHRIGQTRPVDYYVLLADCLVETAIWESLEAKQEIRESMLVDVSRRLTPLV